MEIIETKFQRGLRLTTAVLMALQTLMYFFVAGFLFFFILFMGGMASVVGGGNVSEEQFKNTWYMIGFMAVYPEISMILMIIATVQIFRRKRPIFIAIACILFIGPYLWVMYMASGDDEIARSLSLAALVPIVVPLVAIFVATQMRQKINTHLE